MIRPPPPRYIEALKYPYTKKGHVSKSDHRSKYYQQKEHIYQTLPGDHVYLYCPDHYYNTRDFKGKTHLYTYKNSASGKPVIFLAPISETLASSAEMGVKTYAQLEVVAACSGKEDHIGDRCNDMSCMEALVNGQAVLLPKVDHSDAVENGGTVLGPIEEHENEDDFDIRASLSSLCSNLDLNNSDLENASQLEIDIISLSKAIAENDERCANRTNSETETHIGEICVNGEVRIKIDQNAQLTVNSQNSTDIDIDDDRTPTGSQNHGDSGYSDSSKLEFNEHVSEHCVEPVIYSEPEYSSSDVSIKGAGDTPNHEMSQCQRTLKRTYNGVDHNVYELSPSDSFYSSVGENLPGADGGNPSLNSSEGINRLSHSSGSLADHQRKKVLIQDTRRKTSFKEPLVRNISNSGSLGQTSDTEQKTMEEGEAETAPLVSASSLQNEDCTDNFPEQLVCILRLGSLL